jgi:hypothetical protein
VEGFNKITKLTAKWLAKDAPLGADDGAGVAMLMHLIHSGVRAYYIFTQGEEVGGIGAKFIADNYPLLLEEFDRAIAFDRRGIDSVITHQGWTRCCSDEFADALSDALNVDESLMYLPDDSGVYTDTAEFTDVIPECTNISVGYYHEHTDKEYLDIVHFALLAERVINIDWDGLPTQRDPKVIDSKWDMQDYSYGAYSYNWDKTADNSFSYGRNTSLYKDHLMADLQDAIMDAQIGHFDFLLDLMAEIVYPEDTTMAVRMMDRKKLTEEVLEDMLYRAWVEDPSALLAELFDMCYVLV